MSWRETLITAADAYCARTGMSKARLATIVVNDGKFFDRIARGGGFTDTTFDKFMAYFAENAETAAAEAAGEAAE